MKVQRIDGVPPGLPHQSQLVSGTFEETDFSDIHSHDMHFQDQSMEETSETHHAEVSMAAHTSGSGKGKGESKKETVTLDSVMTELRAMNANLTSKFDILQAEITSLRADMVNQTQFLELQTRVEKLESNQSQSQINFLRQQLSRLDPAHKSICMRGFGDNDGESRTKTIEQMLLSKVAHIKASRVEHVYIGTGAERKISNMTIVEFATNALREQVLKKTSETHIEDAQGHVITVARAKTAAQLHRNGAMRRALKMIKSHAAARGREPQINWKVENSKDRTIEVDNTIVFSQSPNDIGGIFRGPFSNLVL